MVDEGRQVGSTTSRTSVSRRNGVVEGLLKVTEENQSDEIPWECWDLVKSRGVPTKVSLFE